MPWSPKELLIAPLRNFATELGTLAALSFGFPPLDTLSLLLLPPRKKAKVGGLALTWVAYRTLASTEVGPPPE